MTRLEALKARNAALAAEVSAAALTTEEQELARELALERTQLEALAAAGASRRAVVMSERLAAARGRLGAGVILEAVDLVALFPLGSAPPVEALPNGGVLVIRNPPDGADEAAVREIEAKARSMASISAALVRACAVDPDASAPDAGGQEGLKLSGFLTQYAPAAIVLGTKCRDLGGAKSTADKRGNG